MLETEVPEDFKRLVFFKLFPTVMLLSPVNTAT
jgi:hypothetical protein